MTGNRKGYVLNSLHLMRGVKREEIEVVPHLNYLGLLGLPILSSFYSSVLSSLLFFLLLCLPSGLCRNTGTLDLWCT